MSFFPPVIVVRKEPLSSPVVEQDHVPEAPKVNASRKYARRNDQYLGLIDAYRSLSQELRTRERDQRLREIAAHACNLARKLGLSGADHAQKFPPVV